METVTRRVRTYWLSMHLPYQCRHAGACCTSGWDIPIEQSRVDAVSEVRARVEWLRPMPTAGPEVAGAVAKTADGRCVFHGGGCAIQRVRGHAALPAACQHFPRQVLMDPRGVFVSLSHFCPTAAELLFSHEGPVEIVEGPPAVPDGEPEGLDARDVLPPLLAGAGGRDEPAGSGRFGARSCAVPGLASRCQVSHRGARSRIAVSGLASRRQVSHRPVLMDFEGYADFEAHMVAVLTCGAASAEDALKQLDADLRRLQQWRPGKQSLSAEIAKLPRTRGKFDDNRSDSRDDAVIRRYLAARAFACWAAYQSADGIVAVLRHLRIALTLVRELHRRQPLKEAIRLVDLRLIHRVDRGQEAPSARTI
jgi:hypothetical protein